ncbi:MAG TPA: DUF4238 domain-containing protein [Candidatus Tyrphobacter sp.]
MTAKRHHFISQCYLRGFTENPASPKLFVVDFKKRRMFLATLANVALQRDFHTIDALGVEPDIVEKKLAEGFESDLGPALRRIVATGSLDDEKDRGLVFFFMALLFIKNPAMRDTIGEFIGRVAEFQMKMKAANPEAWEADMARAKSEGTIPQDADTSEMRRHVLKGNFKYGLSVPGHLHMEFRTVSDLLPYFHGRKWMLCRSAAGQTGFITSDNPVCLMWQDPSRREPPGLGGYRTQLVFSVSNELAILGTYESAGRTVEADDDLIAVINGNILPSVNRQVYARAGDFMYAMPHNKATVRGFDLLEDPVSRR